MSFFKNLFKQPSKSHLADASDDIVFLVKVWCGYEDNISQVEIRTEPNQPTRTNLRVETPEIETEHVGVYFGKSSVDLPFELLLYIGGFMHVGELRALALCHSKVNMLFFNVKKEEIGLKRNYERDDEILDFKRVQQLIWKPLVFAYYPKFEKQSNVKNWMHLLRRRLQHLKLHGNSYKLDIPTFVETEKDEQFIENCEWIYKCPLKYDALPLGIISGERYCNVCEKKVFKVDSMESFISNIKQGNCVAFTNEPNINDGIPPEPIMGAAYYPEWEIEPENLLELEPSRK